MREGRSVKATLSLSDNQATGEGACRLTYPLPPAHNYTTRLDLIFHT